MPSLFGLFASLQSSFNMPMIFYEHSPVFSRHFFVGVFFSEKIPRTPQQALPDRPKVDLALIEQARFDVCRNIERWDFGSPVRL